MQIFLFLLLLPRSRVSNLIIFLPNCTHRERERDRERERERERGRQTDRQTDRELLKLPVRHAHSLKWVSHFNLVYKAKKKDKKPQTQRTV